jgi:hypothetical protein
MYHFCTLFDSNYLSRGLTLYRSLESTCHSFHLYVFAFDDRCERILRALSLPHTTVISLREFEDQQLLKVKPSRTRAEYCWTATSSTILYVLDRFNVDTCTYLDADLMFFSSPQPIFEELGSDSILITEHRYTRRYDKSALSGIYCVQFVTFRNDERGRKALEWWRARCLEWCYDRVEDGKFGDQKYLDDWTQRFEGVHVLQHLGAGLAAWNVQQFDILKDGDNLRCRERSTGRLSDVVFLRADVRTLVYRPYIGALERAKREVIAMDSGFDPHGMRPDKGILKRPILWVFRKLTGIYNIFPLKEFLED